MDTPEQVGSLYRLSLFHHLHTRFQTARNRELTEIAFPNDSAPKYGPAILLPVYCGKWIVSLEASACHLSRLNVVLASGTRDPLTRMAQGSYQ
jgi:hypothetical protein